MSKKCQVTGRKPVKGLSHTTRGIAKKKKGIGLNITGTTHRYFQPNLVWKKFWFAEENRFVRLKVSTAGMRTVDKKGVATMVQKMRAEGQKI